MRIMNFSTFLYALSKMKADGWTVSVRKSKCYEGGDHEHLVLRLRPPGKYGKRPWLPILKAVVLAEGYGSLDDLPYHDPNYSLDGIRRASETLDWLGSGYLFYARARLAIMRELGITVETVRERGETLQKNPGAIRFG